MPEPLAQSLDGRSPGDTDISCEVRWWAWPKRDAEGFAHSLLRYPDLLADYQLRRILCFVDKEMAIKITYLHEARYGRPDGLSACALRR